MVSGSSSIKLVNSRKELRPFPHPQTSSFNSWPKFSDSWQSVESPSKKVRIFLEVCSKTDIKFLKKFLEIRYIRLLENYALFLNFFLFFLCSEMWSKCETCGCTKIRRNSNVFRFQRFLQLCQGFLFETVFGDLESGSGKEASQTELHCASPFVVYDEVSVCVHDRILVHFGPLRQFFAPLPPEDSERGLQANIPCVSTPHRGVVVSQDTIVTVNGWPELGVGKKPRAENNCTGWTNCAVRFGIKSLFRNHLQIFPSFRCEKLRKVLITVFI